MTEKTIACAVILCAGASSRMGKNKMLLKFGGKTPMEHSLIAFARTSCVKRIILAVSPETESEAYALKERYPQYDIAVIGGGRERGDSVFNALELVNEPITAIHDAARFLVTSEIISDSIEAAAAYGSGITAVLQRDTVRRIKDGETIDRNTVVATQTPQSFRTELIKHAYKKAREHGISATDDCAIFITVGNTPHYTKGNIKNQKLTRKEDMDFFRAFTEPKAKRVGYGEDTHRLTEGRKLILGGADIPFERGLLGHSDADALAHAVIDALLGAAALGDIGRHFPPSDDRYLNADSIELLKIAGDMLKNNMFTIINIDATIICEKPKLAPYIDLMRDNIAGALGLLKDAVSVKATTSEGMNAEGRSECVTVRCVCIIE